MRIGRYQILEELGRGGMGAVYRGVDPDSGRAVAIKVLTGGNQATPRQRQRFAREARALSKVDHPNVVRVWDVGEEGGRPYLVLDYHPGGSLQESVERGTLLPLEVAELGVGLAAGLAAAHAVGVLHRDIKPENVLLRPDGGGLLVDFGLAKDLTRAGQTEQLTQTGTLLGTPGFWAPEQAAGISDAFSPATDVYGLGATLYAALTGQPPIVGESLVEIAIATREQTPPLIRSLRPDVPQSLEAVVMRCLEKAPEARWPSAEALGEALGSYASPRARSRRPLLLLAAALSAITILAGALTVWALAPPTAQPQVATTRAPASPSPRTSSGTSPLVPNGPQGEAYLGLGIVEAAAGRHEEAVRLYRQAAALGNSNAMLNLGFTLGSGRVGPKDQVEEVRWYRRSAALGNPEAMFNLGIMFERGKGVAPDGPTAVEWYRRAAEGGSREALNGLAEIYMTGRVVPKDPKTARSWYRKAAEAEHPRAMYNLALLLTTGLGGHQDSEEGLVWYRRAANAGEPNAMDTLGTFLAAGQLGVAKDPKEAVLWFRRAAEVGHPGGLFHLGLAHENGLGVPKNSPEALRLYRRAAELDNPSGMLGLGRALVSGLGTTKDLEEGASWLRRAAQTDERRIRDAARRTLQGLALNRGGGGR